MNQSGNCKYCGSPLYEGMKFCGNCGKPVEQPAGQVQEAAEQVQQSVKPMQEAQQPINQSQESDSQEKRQRNRAQEALEWRQENQEVQQPSQEMQWSPRQMQQSSGQRQVRRERPEAGNESYDPNSYENRVRRANNRRSYDDQSGQSNREAYNGNGQANRRSYNDQNGQPDRSAYNRQNERAKRGAYNGSNGQMNRKPQDDQIVRQNQQAAQKKQRYRQEDLEKDWQQSWDRLDEEEDGKFTPIQYVLVGIAIVLMMALVGFGVYWILGRSTGNTGRRQNQNSVSTEMMQTDLVEAESVADIMILDDTQDKETESEKVTEKVTETETETESETNEPQTEMPQDTVLTYPEFKVTIPGSWRGKYGIEQSDGSYTFYQQAARDAGYGGVLFMISRYTDTSYKTLPNYEVIGTGGGAALVYRLSNDLQYPKENAAVAAEYQAMANNLSGIRTSIEVLISGEGPKETEAVPDIEIISEDYYVIEEPAADNTSEPDYSGGYIPSSSERVITESDVAGMSYDDMQMAINEIYARHGRIFQTESISSYFNSQSWYNGTVTADNFDESVFSSVESQNIQILLEMMGN